MGRPLRPDYTNTYHHVVVRGINGLPIFDSEKKRSKFLSLIRDVRKEHDLRIYAFGFLFNHWHAFLRRVNRSMARFFQTVKSRYTRWYNDKFDRESTLYDGRYFSSIVEAESYFQRVWLYVQSQGVAVDQYDLPAEDPRSTAGLFAGVDTTYQWIDWEEALSTLNVPDETKGIDFEALIEEHLLDELPIRRERDQNFIASDDYIEKYMQIRRENVRQNDRDESPLSWETLLDGVTELFDVTSDSILQATKQRRINRLRCGLTYAARRYGHKSTQEIADKLNVSDTTVSRMVKKAKNKHDNVKKCWDEWILSDTSE